MPDELHHAPSPGHSPWQPPTPEELAALLPQYRIVALIGRGGMGAVYKGEQATLERPVAIKLLPAELAADSQFIARFQREARTLARLQHPGIVAVYDFGQTTAGHLYFIMEYVDGTDLHRVLHGPGLKPAQALELLGQICDALQYAHGQGVIHRDIKPANILLNMQGRAKLGDFGLARPLNGEAQDITSTNVVMGTPDYMAPEQRVGIADHRADIFALGVMLYEMLTGRTPRGVFEPPSKKVAVDVRIDSVVLKALQSEPELRYQAVSELKTDLDRIRTTRAVPIATPRAKPVRTRGKGANSYVVAVATLIAAVLVGLAIHYWPQHPGSVEKPDTKPQARSASDPQTSGAIAAPEKKPATPDSILLRKATPTPVAVARAATPTPAPATPRPSTPTITTPTPQLAAMTTPAPQIAAMITPIPVALAAPATRTGKGRVLFLTYSAAYQHEATRRTAGDYSPAEKALMKAAAGSFTVEPTQMAGAINRMNLRNFDAVAFYTSGELPIDAEGKKALLDFVREGGAFAGIHSAADTFYTFAGYGEMLGGYLNGHPGVNRIWVKVDDRASPATAGLGDAFEIAHEAFQFKNWSRSSSHTLLSIDPRSLSLMQTPALLAVRSGAGTEYPVAWTRTYGRGRVFYTALGHNVADWSDPRFLQHVVGGIQGILGNPMPPATPSAGLTAAAGPPAATAPLGVTGRPLATHASLPGALTGSPWTWGALAGAASASWTEIHFSTTGTYTAYSGKVRVATGSWAQSGPLKVTLLGRSVILIFDDNFTQFTGMDETGISRYRGRRQL